MRVCSTPGCPTLVKAGAYKGRCTACNRAAGRARGTREQQGYGATHRREREAIVKRINSGQTVTCWRCHEPITDPADMHLGHDDHDRSITRGPEHAACNLQAAGRNTPRG